MNYQYFWIEKGILSRAMLGRITGKGVVECPVQELQLWFFVVWISTFCVDLLFSVLL